MYITCHHQHMQTAQFLEVVLGKINGLPASKMVSKKGIMKDI